jgi:hypothetical protein
MLNLKNVKSPKTLHDNFLYSILQHQLFSRKKPQSLQFFQQLTQSLQNFSNSKEERHAKL